MTKNKTAPSSTTVQRKRNLPFISYLLVFIVGFLAGITFTLYKSPPPLRTSVEKTAEQPRINEVQQAILNLETEVTSHPNNDQAWLQLGHLYYDTNQPQKAITAYTKSMAIVPANADLLTDLGVMYRKNKQPEKAVASFDKAIKLDSNHQPARFNKGIVLLYDLDKPRQALLAWQEILKFNPNAKSTDGTPLRNFIARLKKEKNL